ncbi:hypothetical protein M9H77_22564 [Catharanthus roseus]|uniref:Uncharacterized protein n=1 Tax=Catharanthus roseus TaxID=4058 RepID=A0ACC0AUV9_CATRO|nr:hypothetical protein M9H77_22564 [Catharanthus roseus]
MVDRGLPTLRTLCVLNVLKCIEEEEVTGDLKDTVLILTMVAIAIGEILMKLLPLLLGVFDPEEYLDWEEMFEALFYAYEIFEEDKLRNGSTQIISWESLKRDLRDKFGILDYQEVETPVGKFCDPSCKKSDYIYIEEKCEGGSNGRRCHEMLKDEQIKKASRVERSSRGIKPPTN